MAFDADGHSLLSASVDGEVYVWPIPDKDAEPRLLEEWVQQLVEQEQFDNARAPLETLITRPWKRVHNPWSYLHRNFEIGLGLLHTRLEDREAHERFSKELLRRFASTQDPFEARCCAKAYLVMPGPHDPRLLEQAIHQARRSTELGAESYHIDWFECCRGIAEFRGGADAEAIKWLRKATDGPFDYALLPLLHAYQAMAEFRLGHRDEAKRLLGEAQRLLGEMERWTSKLDWAGDFWQDTLHCQLAVEEANSLILGKGDR